MTNNTLRGTSLALGVGLAILWIAGLSSPYAAGWLTWLDGVAALFAFIISGSIRPYDTSSKRMGGPVVLSVGLFAMWIIGMVTGTVAWLTWWTFAFACAFLLTGVGAYSGTSTPEITADEEHLKEKHEDRFRRTG